MGGVIAPYAPDTLRVLPRAFAPRTEGHKGAPAAVRGGGAFMPFFGYSALAETLTSMLPRVARE
jgi:hypothetical protein